MLFQNKLCLVRGGGDLATGVIYRLHRAGFPVGVLELEQPRVVRRRAAYAEAIYSEEISVGGVTARRTTLEGLDALRTSAAGLFIPVAVDPNGLSIGRLRPEILIDARMAKRPLDTRADQASLVIGLGPGLEAGVNCTAVVETNRGHDLGRVIWHGQAQPDTGTPETVLGFGNERVLRAPAAGRLEAIKEIGDLVRKGDLLATVAGEAVTAPFDGVLRGMVHAGLQVAANEKIGDLDPRGRREACYTISDKSLAAGGGVVEAALTWLQAPDPRRAA